MRPIRVLAVIAMALTTPLCATGGPLIPRVVKAEPAPEREAKFDLKDGWIGGDGVYSAAVGAGRVLWTFGDTILGRVKDGRRVDAVMVNNTVAVQDGRGRDAPVRFVTGKGKDGKPAAVFVPSDGRGWFWPLDAVEVKGKLFAFLTQIDKAGDGGPFGFKQLGQVLAVVENPEDEPEKWKVSQHRVPFGVSKGERETSWGSAVLARGDHLYVYGWNQVKERGFANKRLTVARVPAEKPTDFAAWRFRTSAGWSEKAAEAVPLADHLANEFSVTALPGGKGYVAVYTENGLSDRIVGRFADAPEGPWSGPVLLYRCPEAGADKGVFSYAAKAHPWAAAGNELVISYCVNSWDFGRLFQDDRVYRPRFVRVELGAVK